MDQSLSLKKHKTLYSPARDVRLAVRPLTHSLPRTSHPQPVATSPGRRLAPSHLAPRTSNPGTRAPDPEPRTLAQSPSPPVSKSLRNSNNFTIFIETADIIIPFLFSD